MKKIFYSIILLVMIFSHQTATAQTGNTVPSYIQEQTNWCWAACGQMIYWAYHSGSISQCTFVNKSRDQENALAFDCNNLSSSTSSACTYPATFNSPQTLYTCGGSIENVLDYYGIRSTGYSHAFSTSELTTAMTARRMVIARWAWNSGGGHVVVVNRYKSGNVYYNDPLYGAKIWSYNTFKTSNGKATWANTLRMDGAAVYGSALYRNTTPKDDVPGIVPETSTSEQIADDRLELNLYPNPAVENVTILVGRQRTDVSEVIILNSVGVIVYRQQVANKAGNLKVNVSQWPSGVYVVKLGGTRITKQFVVQ